MTDRPVLGAGRREGVVLPWVAGVWAVLEATVFFVLPDFFVAPAVIARPRLIWRLVGATLIGTVAGTLVLAAAVVVDPVGTRAMITALPFTTDAMFATVGDGRADDLAAVFAQPYSGIPAKVWTWTAVADGGFAAAGAFFVVLALGRAIRFAVVAGVAWLAERLLGTWLRRFARFLVPVYVVVFFAGLWFVSA
ncbi:hypothetical protein GCM10028784_00970 [Myceligenerans cantabricum]